MFGKDGIIQPGWTPPVYEKKTALPSWRVFSTRRKNSVGSGESQDIFLARK
jgi:hypothetical protein